MIKETCSSKIIVISLVCVAAGSSRRNDLPLPSRYRSTDTLLLPSLPQNRCPLPRLPEHHSLCISSNAISLTANDSTASSRSYAPASDVACRIHRHSHPCVENPRSRRRSALGRSCQWKTVDRKQEAGHKHQMGGRYGMPLLANPKCED